MLLNRYINYGANAAVVDEKEKRDATKIDRDRRKLLRLRMSGVTVSEKICERVREVKNLCQADSSLQRVPDETACSS